MHERQLQELLDDGRAERAQESRERQRVLEQVQRETATFAGTLLDLAERRAQVSVRVAGTTVAGILDAMGADVVRVAGTWIRTSAITTVRVHAGPATGDRTPPDDLTLASVLGRLAEDRARVLLLLAAVGEDVASVRQDGDGRMAYVPTATVAALRPTS